MVTAVFVEVAKVTVELETSGVIEVTVVSHGAMVGYGVGGLVFLNGAKASWPSPAQTGRMAAVANGWVFQP